MDEQQRVFDEASSRWRVLMPPYQEEIATRRYGFDSRVSWEAARARRSRLLRRRLLRNRAWRLGGRTSRPT